MTLLGYSKRGQLAAGLGLAVASLFAGCESGAGDACESDGFCADNWTLKECQASIGAAFHVGVSCADIGYSAPCFDGSDHHCPGPEDLSGGEPPVGGCTDTCNFASDGACDDGGPGSDYGLCTLGTDCTDCGSRGSSDPGPGPGMDDDGAELHSTLCFEVTTGATTQNLEVKCTPDASLSCAELGMQASQYVYSSRAACLVDSAAVIAHWQSTGVIGGGTSDLNLGSSGAGGGGGVGGAGGSGGGGAECPDDFPYPTLEAVPRGNVNLHIAGCYVGNHCAASGTQRWDSHCVGAGGSCGFGAVQEYCGTTFNLRDVTSFFYNYHIDGTSIGQSATWRPAFHGDTLELTLQ